MQWRLTSWCSQMLFISRTRGWWRKGSEGSTLSRLIPLFLLWYGSSPMRGDILNFQQWSCRCGKYKIVSTVPLGIVAGGNMSDFNMLNSISVIHHTLSRWASPSPVNYHNTGAAVVLQLPLASVCDVQYYILVQGYELHSHWIANNRSFKSFLHFLQVCLVLLLNNIVQSIRMYVFTVVCIL